MANLDSSSSVFSSSSMELGTLDTEIAKGLLRIPSKESTRQVRLAELQREKDKAPILTWKHMAFNICQDSKSNDLPGRALW